MYCKISLTSFNLNKKRPLSLMHSGVSVSHCITWFQTQLILTTWQICYHSHLWHHRSTGQL